MIRTSFMVKWRANSSWMDNVVEWTAPNRHRGSQRALKPRVFEFPKRVNALWNSRFNLPRNVVSRQAINLPHSAVASAKRIIRPQMFFAPTQ